MRKLLACAALVLAAAAVAAGREGGAAPVPSRPEDASAEAARLLKSRGARERAWGAYLAGAHGLKEHAPLVVGLLEDPEAAAAGGEEWAAVRRSALDALIRLDAEAPAEWLLPLYQFAPDEAVILLARDPARNARALLTLFADETPDARWVALGNLLAEARAAGFAACLLAGLEVRASVFVHDSEGDRGYNGGGGDGCGVGRGGVDTTPEGFPPAGRYALTSHPARGVVVVARGRHMVYYVRSVPGGGYVSDASCSVPRDSYRVGYVADLLGTTAQDLPLQARPFHAVVCRDAQGCRRALAELRDETARDYAVVVGQLLGAGLLDTAEAAGLSPDLTLNLYDQRDARSFPLPEKLEGVKIYLVRGAADEDGGGRP